MTCVTHCRGEATPNHGFQDNVPFLRSIIDTSLYPGNLWHYFYDIIDIIPNSVNILKPCSQFPVLVRKQCRIGTRDLMKSRRFLHWGLYHVFLLMLISQKKRTIHTLHTAVHMHCLNCNVWLSWLSWPFVWLSFVFWWCVIGFGRLCQGHMIQLWWPSDQIRGSRGSQQP